MRTSKTHKIAVAGVAATIATATVLTFTRSDTAAADRIASLPQTSNDAPVVAHEPAPTPKTTSRPRPTPTPDATTGSPDAAARPSTQEPKDTAKPEPTRTTTRPPATQPTPSPSPTPREKNLIEILLGM